MLFTFSYPSTQRPLSLLFLVFDDDEGEPEFVDEPCRVPIEQMRVVRRADRRSHSLFTDCSPTISGKAGLPFLSLRVPLEDDEFCVKPLRNLLFAGESS